MKSTGIIRRIDELGRIVVPKEIRKNLRIHNGDNLEIFIDNDSIVLKKHSIIGKLENLTSIIIYIIKKTTDYNVFISDCDKILDDNKYELKNKDISNEFRKILEKREIYISLKKDNFKITCMESIDGYFYICPIVIDSQLIGSFVVVSNSYFNDSDINYFNFVNLFLKKYLED